MAKQLRKSQSRSRAATKSTLPYSKRNYQLFGLSALVILVGYWALARGPVNGFLSLTLAPILLVIGYCVLIPLAIIYTGKAGTKEKDNST